MPISVNGLLKTAGLNSNRLKTIQWGEALKNSSVGIYIVSTCADPSENSNHFENAPIDEEKLCRWIRKIKSIQINITPHPIIEDLKQRINRFWLPDESIVYIGQTECRGGLEKRMQQFYNTELGDRRLHIGGQWVKVLKDIDRLFIHSMTTLTPVDAESALMQHFAAQVSEVAKKKIGKHLSPLPFANFVHSV